MYLTGEHATGETLSVAFAGKDQHQDTGSKMVHMAPHTNSSIVSKSVARKRRPRRLSRPGADRRGRERPANSVVCDALLVDTVSRPTRTRTSTSGRTT